MFVVLPGAANFSYVLVIEWVFVKHGAHAASQGQGLRLSWLVTLYVNSMSSYEDFFFEGMSVYDMSVLTSVLPHDES